MKFDIILQNNASKQFFLFPKQENLSDNHLYLVFDIDLDLPEGEYTVVCLENCREDDVKYTYKTPILSTLLTVDDTTIQLRDLKPRIGLLRVGKEVKEEAVYDDSNNNIFYYDE